MRVVVIGGSGLVGSRVTRRLAARGHSVLAASPATGVNTLTGEGLDEAMQGADLVIDVANSPDFSDEGVMSFFRTAGSNLAAAERRAGVSHHIALSVVGADRLQDSGYIRGKLAQEALVAHAGLPWTILRATQFFEFIPTLAALGARDDEIRAPDARVQPIAVDDVADILAMLAEEPPAGGLVEAAGPGIYPMVDLMARILGPDETRRLVADPGEAYFGATLARDTLLPGGNARIGRTALDAWLQRSA